MKPNVIVMSHGNMAKEAVASAKMIVGDLLSASVVSMEAQDGLAGTKEKLEKAVEEFQEEPILVIADLYGGTPFNTAIMLAKTRPNTVVISGLNLNMLIEYSVTQIEDLQELADYLCEIGKQGILRPEISEDVTEEEDEIEVE